MKYCMSGCMSSSLYLIYTLKSVYLMHDWLIVLQCSDLRHCPVISCHCKIWLSIGNCTIFVMSAVQNLCLLSTLLSYGLNALFFLSRFFKKLFFYPRDLDTGQFLPAFSMCKNEHNLGKSHSSLQELQQILKKESCSEQEHNAEYDTYICILF